MIVPSLDLLFAWTIAVLAGAACIGALVVVLVREWYAIRDTIRRHRRPAPESYWRTRSALTVPERRS
jgi:O-antigen ligase